MKSYMLDIWKIKLLNVESAIVTLTLIPHCPALNSSKIFAFGTTCFNFIFLSVCQSLGIGHASFGHLLYICYIHRTSYLIWHNCDLGTPSLLSTNCGLDIFTCLTAWNTSTSCSMLILSQIIHKARKRPESSALPLQ